MDVSLFDYTLPESLIAQTPAVDRTGSRLLCLDRNSGEVSHLQFANIIQLLNKGDTLVLNDTKVIPARLFGVKHETGAKAEVLLLKDLGADRWEALVRPAKKLKTGDTIRFVRHDQPETDEHEVTGSLSAVITEEGEMGARVLHFQYEGIFNEWLEQLGQMPLPPYIKQQLGEQERYQTVYAKHEGSAAAPTAGLHFSQSLLEEIKAKGIHIAYITLHVGLGTFRPVNVERVEDHVMHEEYYELSAEAADMINKTRQNGGRIIAVGTTSARALEAAAQAMAKGDTEPNMAANALQMQAVSGWTNIYIYPGYSFQVVDALLTNFHLPKSTLLMLISAFAGRETVLSAYEEAVRLQYRFFSFGDAMFIH